MTTGTPYGLIDFMDMCKWRTQDRKCAIFGTGPQYCGQYRYCQDWNPDHRHMFETVALYVLNQQ